MSKLKEQLQNDLKESMKSKDNFKRDTIRFLMSALKQVEVDERKELSDEDIIKLIQKSLKQREDSATAFKLAQREDLYEKESQEAAILKTYLPQQLDDNELKEIVVKYIAQTGATSMKDIGKVMGLVLGECAGVADGKRINGVIKELLS